MRMNYVCKWDGMEEVRRDICMNEAKYQIGENAGESCPVEPEPPTLLCLGHLTLALVWAR
jgi:hypothetical protein